MKPKENESPILIPSNSYLEGYLKSLKSIRIECNFNGTILTNKKVIIDKTSFVIGDIICEDLILSGRIKGNVFCTGRVEMSKDSVIEGKVYTSMFTNNSETDSDFVIQIPKKPVLVKIREYLKEINTDVGLSKDEILTTVRESFYKNVFARKSNPNDLIKYEFTNQLKILKQSIDKSIKSEDQNEEFITQKMKS
ncbi:polymer-forming cytoskeletal protein [Flavobacteriaceae bacterium]|nr:polymer-forming cytoskeletal protein [Flavobacteriaceae bacterium]